MRKMGEQLLFKLRPIASGNHGHFDDSEKVMQQRRHFGIESRFAFGERAVQIKNNQLLHSLSIPELLPALTAFGRFPVLRFPTNSLHRAGRNVHAPTTAGKSHTSPFRDGIRVAAVLDLPVPSMHTSTRGTSCGADGERRFSAQAPQPERVAIEEPLALHRRLCLHHGHHQPGCTIHEIDAGKRLIDLRVPAACLSSHPRGPSRTGEMSRRCSAEPRTPQRRRPESEPSQPG